MKRKYIVTTDDFIRHLNAGLNLEGGPPHGLKFKEIHAHLKTVYPSMVKLANLLENVLFLKIVLLGELHINVRTRLSLNDTLTATNYGLVRPRVCRFIC